MKKIWSFFGGLGLLVVCQATVLAQDFTITGSIQDGSGNGIGGQIAILDPVSGDQIAEIFVNGDGSPTTSGPIPAGQYVAYAGRRFGTEGFVEERWDGGDAFNLSCPNLSCDVLGGALIDLTTADVTGIDFILDPNPSGGRLSGNLVYPDGVTPVVGVSLVAFSAAGFEIHGVFTDRFGNFSMPLMSDGDVYLRVQNDAPDGLAPELWNGGEPNNTVCVPFDLCFDTANGSPITIGGTDVGALDFQLEVPAGGQVVGSFEDTDNGFALSDMNVDLLDPDGNFVANVQTDATGTYTFAGLADGDYKVFISGPTEGYPQYLIGQGSCSIGCDPVNNGALFNVTGGITNVPPEQIAYEGGPRITGIITRSDTGEPVSSRVGFAGADLFDTVGNGIGGAGTDLSGRYQLVPPGGAGDYVVISTHDQGFHILINEIFNDVACGNNCDPNDPGRTVISVPDTVTRTAIADFGLDTGRSISGTVVSTVGDAPIEGLTVCAEPEPEPDGQLIQCVNTDASGNYSIAGLVARADYVVSTFNNGLPFFDEVYDDLRDVPLSSGTLIDVTSVDATGINFALDPAGTISGAIQDELGNPLNDFGAVEIVVLDASGNEVSRGNNNGDNTWQSPTLAAGDYFVYAFGEQAGFTTEVWNNVDCPSVSCDVLAVGTAVMITGGDVPGIDFTLSPVQAFTITGSIRDAGGNGIGGQIAILDPNTGDQVAEVFVDGNGNGTTAPIPAGQYVAYAGRRFGAEGFAEEVWNNGEPFNLACPNLSCDLFAGARIDLTAGDVSGIDFVLDPIAGGGRLSGTVTDPLGNPVVGVSLIVLSADGFNVQDGVVTDRFGTFTTRSLSDGDVYLRVENDAPDGLAPELWNGGEPNNTVCTPFAPFDPCFDLVANGSPITVAGGDVGLLDFELEVPVGGQLTGRIIDADLFFPLAEVNVELLDTDGSFIAAARTDRTGSYTFAGLADGDYKLLVNGPPEGYEPTLFGFGTCNGCDIAANGTTFTVAGQGVTNNPDEPMTYAGGPRLTGFITRSDTGEPVPNVGDRFAGVNIYDSAGNFLGGYGTDRSGRYQVSLASGDYRAVTFNGHGLVDELFENIPCAFGCDPNDPAATPIAVPNTGSVTGRADFALDPGRTISGTLRAEDDLSAIADANVCIGIASEAFNGFRDCRSTDSQGRFSFGGLLAIPDYVVGVQSFAGQLFISELFDDAPCCNLNQGTPIDTSLADRDIAIEVARSAAISGTIVQTGSLIPIQGVDVQIFDQACVFVASAQSDAGGNYTATGFVEGDYFVYARANFAGFVPELYPDLKRLNPCSPNPIGDGTPINVPGLQQVLGINFLLDRGASISGFVSDAIGVLPSFSAQARLHDLSGTQLFVGFNDQPDNSYLLQGLPADDYNVVLSGAGQTQGLVDEIFDNIQCPRNSCPQGTGVTISLSPGEARTGISAVLDVGSQISGRLTDALGNPVSACVAVYNAEGRYAGFACSDANGDYTTRNGFPAGDYLLSNQFNINGPQPVEGGFIPTVWPGLACGEPCNFLVGDPIVVDGVNPVTGINLVFQTGSSISGLVTGDGAPVGGVQVRLLNATDGALVRSVLSGADGTYAFEGIGAGDYLLRSSNSIGLNDQLYSGISCNPFCDPFSGAVVNLPPDTDVTGIDFPLVSTPRIAGTVFDDIGAPVGGVRVEAYNSLGALVASATSAADGSFEIGNLFAGTFFVRTANTLGLVDALADGLFCPPGCNPALDGTGIGVGSSGTFPSGGLELRLGDASSLFGQVTDGTNPLAAIEVEVYTPTGDLAARRLTGDDGRYRIDGLAAGSYHVVTRNGQGFIDESATGAACPADCVPTTTPAIELLVSQQLEIDFALSQGGSISGRVTDALGGALPSVEVTVFTDSGVQVSGAITDASGNYTISALLPDDYVARTTSNPHGLRNRLYDDRTCDADCNVLAGTLIPVAFGAAVTGIDFTLPDGKSISGSITDASGDPIGGVRVAAFDAAGIEAASAVTGSSGLFSITGLPDGIFRLRTFNSLNFIDRAIGGDECTPNLCELTLATPFDVQIQSQLGADAGLRSGQFLTGTATDDSGNPIFSGTAQLYGDQAELLKTAPINEGTFTFSGLAGGTYYAVVTNGLGLVDQAWTGPGQPGLDCPGGSCLSCLTTSSCDSPPTGPAPIALAPVVRGPVGGSDLSFRLPAGERLQGSVIDAQGNPLPNVEVYFFNDSGADAGAATTNGLGEFESDSAFGSGAWFAATRKPGETGAIGFIDELFDDIPCGTVCDITAGDAFSTPGAPPIDFELDRQPTERIFGSSFEF